MRRFSEFVLAAVALLALLGACTGLPAATAPAPTRVATTVAATAAPGATEAPGSTEAPPVRTTEAASPTSASTEPAPVATTPTGATASPEPIDTPPSMPTTAPEPTMPPAPTAAEAGAPIACAPGALTPEQTEGPYYKTNPPEASDLLQPGMGGTKLTIAGYVFDAECKPVPGARVDFWQADSEGQYDNQGYNLRGYQVTDGEGRYSVETVVPGLYPGRTRHIHVKITPPGGPVLTTQLYFPDESANTRDNIFSSELIMRVEKTADGEMGTFNFAVQTQ